MDAVTEFYNRLITSESPIDPVLQGRIIEHLARLREFSLLGKFASRPDVCPEADVLVRNRSEALVLAGWASRPGRKHEELVERLVDERRVSTLLPLAKMQGLPEEVYRQIAQRSSVKISEALAMNPSVPRELKLERIDEIVDFLDRKKSWEIENLVKEIAGDREEFILPMLRSTTNVSTFLAVLSIPETLSQELVDIAVDRVGVLADDEARSNGHLAPALSMLALYDLSPAQLKKLRPLARKPSDSSRTSLYWSPWGNNLESARFLLSEKGRHDAERIRKLATSTDVEESKALFRALLGSNLKSTKGASPARSESITAAAANTVLPSELLLQLQDDLDRDDERKLVKTWSARGDFKSIAVLATETWGAPDWLEVLDDPRPLFTALIELARSKDEAIPNWVLTHESVYANPDTALMLLPWKSLHEVGEFRFSFDEKPENPAQHEAVMHAAQKLIVERMGTDPQLWEVFVTLANEFEGTLHELLDAVAAIAA
jgi:hypothetical protein